MYSRGSVSVPAVLYSLANFTFVRLRMIFRNFMSFAAALDSFS